MPWARRAASAVGRWRVGRCDPEEVGYKLAQPVMGEIGGRDERVDHAAAIPWQRPVRQLVQVAVHEDPELGVRAQAIQQDGPCKGGQGRVPPRQIAGCPQGVPRVTGASCRTER